LNGVTFAITGTLSESRTAVKKSIESNGGTLANTITKSVQYLIATEAEIENETTKVKKAQSSGIPIVSEAFMNDAIKTGAIPPLKKILINRKRRQ